MGHGHVTPNEGGWRARCGGPGICSTCRDEERDLKIKLEGTGVAPKNPRGLERTITVNKGSPRPIIDPKTGQPTILLSQLKMRARDALTEMLDRAESVMFDTGSAILVALCAIEELTSKRPLAHTGSPPAGSPPDSSAAKMGDSSPPSDGTG